MDNFGEEIVYLIHENKHEEIEKFFVPDEYNEVEKCVYIFRKGFNNHKISLIKNIPKYLAFKEVIILIIEKVVDYIEICDYTIQSEFGSALALIFDQSNDNNYEILKKIFFLVFKLAMKTISLDDTNLNESYLKAMGSITRYFFKYGKVRIENNLIDYAIYKGNYGKSVTSKKYCAFFISCIMQLNNYLNTDLVNRFMMLTSESEPSIRNTIAYHFRFFNRELDEEYLKKYVLKVLESYLNDPEPETRMFIRESIIYTLSKIKDENFLNNFSTKINSYFDLDSKQLSEYHKSLFILIIQEFNNISMHEKHLVPIIKLYIKKHITEPSNHLNKEFKITYCIPYLDKILDILKNDTLLVNDISTFILNLIFDSKSKYYDFQKSGESLKLILKHLPSLIIHFGKVLTNKYIFKYLLFILDNHKKEKELIENFFESLSNFIECQTKIDNNDFIEDFSNSFYQLETFLEKENNHRLTLSFLKALLNNIHFLKSESCKIKMFNHCKNLIFNQNHHVRTYSIKLLVYLLRFMISQREQIMRIIENDIVFSKNFYIRRLFPVFFKQCIEVLSISFMKDLKIFEFFIKLVSENTIISNLLLKTIPSFYALIVNDQKLHDRIIEKIENLKKTHDYELSNTINHFLNIQGDLINFEDIEVNLLLEKEKIKMEEENSFFINEINNEKKKTNISDNIDEYLKKKGMKKTVKKPTTIPVVLPNITGNNKKPTLNFYSNTKSTDFVPIHKQFSSNNTKENLKKNTKVISIGRNNQKIESIKVEERKTKTKEKYPENSVKTEENLKEISKKKDGKFLKK